MKIVAWARVSSREQREGYSLDAQLRAIHERAQREGHEIAREFSIAESAKRGADREEFNAMLAWVKQNRKRENIEGLIFHKLDRACRNMRDAVRLQELQDSLGIKLLFVENQFGPGAAGLFSFNVLAATAQYYSDNLRSEVRKGQLEKCEQGWLPHTAPYGYRNDTADRAMPIKIHEINGSVVSRIFKLCAQARTRSIQLPGFSIKRGLFIRPVSRDSRARH